MEFVFLSEFDVDKGSTLRYSLPAQPPPANEAIAEKMLPEGAHSRGTDFTAFPVVTHSGETLMCFSVVRTRLSDGRRRGADVKALAIASRVGTLDLLRPMLLASLDVYFDSPCERTLSAIFAGWQRLLLQMTSPPLPGSAAAPSLASLQLPLPLQGSRPLRCAARLTAPLAGRSLATALPPAPLSAAAGRPDISSVSCQLQIVGSGGAPISTSDAGAFHPITGPPLSPPLPAPGHAPSATATTLISATFRVPQWLEPDAVPHSASLSSLLRRYGDAGAALIFNAVLLERRVLFLGRRGVGAGDVANCVLSCLHLLLPAFSHDGCRAAAMRRAFPYCCLSDMSFQSVPGYIAGVTNPVFELKRDSYDVLCHVGNESCDVVGGGQPSPPSVPSGSATTVPGSLARIRVEAGGSGGGDGSGEGGGGERGGGTGSDASSSSLAPSSETPKELELGVAGDTEGAATPEIALDGALPAAAALTATVAIAPLAAPAPGASKPLAPSLGALNPSATSVGRGGASSSSSGSQPHIPVLLPSGVVLANPALFDLRMPAAPASTSSVSGGMRATATSGGGASNGGPLYSDAGADAPPPLLPSTSEMSPVGGPGMGAARTTGPVAVTLISASGAPSPSPSPQQPSTQPQAQQQQQAQALPDWIALDAAFFARARSGMGRYGELWARAAVEGHVASLLLLADCRGPLGSNGGPVGKSRGPLGAPAAAAAAAQAAVVGTTDDSADGAGAGTPASTLITLGTSCPLQSLLSGVRSGATVPLGPRYARLAAVNDRRIAALRATRLYAAREAGIAEEFSGVAARSSLHAFPLEGGSGEPRCRRHDAASASQSSCPPSPSFPAPPIPDASPAPAVTPSHALWRLRELALHLLAGPMLGGTPLAEAYGHLPPASLVSACAEGFPAKSPPALQPLGGDGRAASDGGGQPHWEPQSHRRDFLDEWQRGPGSQRSAAAAHIIDSAAPAPSDVYGSEDIAPLALSSDNSGRHLASTAAAPAAAPLLAPRVPAALALLREAVALLEACGPGPAPLHFCLCLEAGAGAGGGGLHPLASGLLHSTLEVRALTVRLLQLLERGQDTGRFIGGLNWTLRAALQRHRGLGVGQGK